MSQPYESIEHIVVLMQENRSFDNMLGWQFGLSGSLFNRSDDGTNIHVWPDRGRDDGAAGDVMSIPDPDPGELFVDMNYQQFETYFPPAGVVPTMGGFVRNYQNQAIATSPLVDVYRQRAIMHCFRPDQVPATSRLAASFGICEPWFASAPCQTWPNRFFVHTATANGWVNNLPPKPWDVVQRFPYDMPTIFNQIKEKLLQFDHGWRIYFHDFPQSLLLSRLWLHLDHFHTIDRFAQDVAKGSLQPYSFIEPRYFPNTDQQLMANDHHPPYDITPGEQLIAQVYDTLRANVDLWKKTLLIVTWDEHGGCYDHVPPPAATPPGGPYPDRFTFDRFGVRVPAPGRVAPGRSRLALRRARQRTLRSHLHHGDGAQGLRHHRRRSQPA
jgi:phospholipase C